MSAALLVVGTPVSQFKALLQLVSLPPHQVCTPPPPKSQFRLFPESVELTGIICWPLLASESFTSQYETVLPVTLFKYHAVPEEVDRRTVGVEEPPFTRRVVIVEVEFPAKYTVAAELSAEEFIVSCDAEKLEEKIKPLELVFEETMFVKATGAFTVCPRVDD